MIPKHRDFTSTQNNNHQESDGDGFIRFSLDGLLICDLQGNILEANDTYCRISGFAAEELRLMNLRDLEIEAAEGGEAPPKIPTITRLLDLLERGGVGERTDPPPRLESVHRTKDGGRVEVEICGAAVDPEA